MTVSDVNERNKKWIKPNCVDFTEIKIKNKVDKKGTKQKEK